MLTLGETVILLGTIALIALLGNVNRLVRKPGGMRKAGGAGRQADQ